jgi:hypothetical protein
MFQAIWKDSERRTTWIVLFVLIVVAIGSISISYYAHLHSSSVSLWDWLDGAAQNFSTEMMGAIVTFGLFELILGSQKAKREKAQETGERQKLLVRKVGSQSSDTAIAALDELRAEGWLTTEDRIALLKEAKLGNANLQGSRLRSANLQAANLEYANLQAAYLRQANLEKALLRFANLQAADLRQANLQAADLRQANLRGAKYIEEAKFDEKTVLPDAVPLKDENGDDLTDENGKPLFDKYWTSETDMTSYINPQHPDFWEPDYLKQGYKGYNKPSWARK